MAEESVAGRPAEAAVDAPRGATRRLSAIMFTDIAGYTALMQEYETGDVLFPVNSRIWVDLQKESRFWAFLDRHGLSRIARSPRPV